MNEIQKIARTGLLEIDKAENSCKICEGTGIKNMYLAERFNSAGLCRHTGSGAGKFALREILKKVELKQDAIGEIIHDYAITYTTNTVAHWIDGPGLRAWREEMGYSLREFAKWVDISPTYLSRIERAVSTKVSARLYKEIDEFVRSE